MIHLVLGFARSGKSRYGEAQFAGDQVQYIATAEVTDAEMAERIAHHQQSRNPNWRTHEAPIALASCLSKLRGQPVMVDCLTVWLNNLLHHQAMDELAKLYQELSDHWQDSGQLVLVSNEVGGGIVPLGELVRRYVDEHGRMNQAVAALAQRVEWIIAGIPTQLK